MASYSTVSFARETEPSKPSIVAQTEKLTEDVKKLLQELFTNCQDSLPLSDILLKLGDICQTVVTDQTYSSYYAFTSFNRILKHYVYLLDNDQFFRAITHDHSKENSRFLRKFLRMVCHCDILEIIKKIPSSVIRTTYFFLLNKIQNSTRIISYLQNNLSNNRSGISMCASLIDVILYVSITLNISLTNTDLEGYQDTLLTLFLTFIDRYFLGNGNHRVNDDQCSALIKRMLCFIAKVTTQTFTVPIFLNLNYPQTCLRWLSLGYLKAYEYTCIINILYNIARHDRGTVLLRTLQCGKTVRQFRDQTFYTNIEFLCAKDLRFMTTQVLNVLLASVVDPDELYTDETDRRTISQILLAVQNASRDVKYHYKNYHISMFLVALMKLCTNDRVLHYVLQQNECPVFFFITLNRLLLSLENKQIPETEHRFVVTAIMALVNILWSLSFHQRYQERLLRDVSLLTKVEKFRDTETFKNFYIPHQLSSLRRSIDGIWQNLYPPVPTSTNILPMRTKPTYSLLISHSQMNIDFCHQLSHVLSSLPELIVTTNSMSNKHLWKEVAQLIEQSDLILFLISRDFFYSKSCRQEFIYGTDIRKKLFFPIFIDSDFQAKDWLHQRIARLKCVRFGQANFLDTCEELVTLVNESLPMKVSSIKNSPNINRWTAEEVKQWFIKNDLLSELCDFYQFQNGKDLTIYHQAIKGCPWKKEYERIEQKFRQKFQQDERLSPEEFEKFLRALERLSRELS